MLSRIKAYLDYKGISIHKFEQSVGMSNGAFANALKKGTTIYADRIENILKTYTDLNPLWLITGKGGMLVEETGNNNEISTAEGNFVPYYDVDFLGGFAEMYNCQSNNPDGMMPEDLVYGAQCWCNLTGHSMEPTINDGDLIALRQENNWKDSISKGKIYAIITTQGLRTVKRAGKITSSNNILLEPDNSEYKPLEIPINTITHVFKVLGSLHKF